MRNKIIFFVILIILAIGTVYAIQTYSKSKNADTSGEEIQGESSEKSGVIEFTDSTYMANLNDIYANYDEYKDKTVKYKGLVYYWEDDIKIIGRKYYCCGTDAFVVGFESVGFEEMPEENSWVEVEGIVKVKEENNEMVPYIEILNIAGTEPGEEYVFF